MKAIRYRCPKCRTPHSADAGAEGKVVVCSSCFGPVVVPKAAGPVAAEASRKPKGSRRRRALILSLDAALVVGLVAVAALGRGRNRPSVEPRPGPAPVVLAPAIEPAPTPEPTPAAIVAAIEAPAPPPPPAAVPTTTPTDPERPLVIRRRQTLGQDALRRQLANLPELVVEDRTEVTLLAIHQVLPPSQPQAQGAPKLGARDRERLKKAAAEERARRKVPVTQEVEATAPARPGMRVARSESAPGEMLAMIAQLQPELSPLPWRMGDECHLGRESAEDLQLVSRALRNVLAQSTPQGDARPDANLLRAKLLETADDKVGGEPQLQAQSGGGNARSASLRVRFLVPAAIPALTQLLMAERTPARLVLAEILGKIPGREATAALARLACFDLAPEVRERATLALRARAAEDYRPTLLGALRYPWAPVADHAAEALVALTDREAVPALKDLLDEPDPGRPRTETRDGRPVRVAKSLVQVNHLQNCVLCHAPSANATLDMVRGRVPDESQPLPPPVEYYGNNSPGLFVRADVTYLRQDFSVTQPVEAAGPWPAYQRYDYLVADRPASALDPDGAKGQDYPQRQSVLFAIRELTGKDGGE